ncbi:MAG TPA: hypothetical protein DEB25_05340, partial [Desulfobulbaceae bacterium]|nr:hypothetical protein [Desulfobulbaceae bacterium]
MNKLPGLKITKNQPVGRQTETRPEQRAERKIQVSDDLIWGTHPVMAALETSPEKIAEIILVQDRKGKKQREIIELAARHRIRLSLCAALRLTGEGAAEA